MNNASELNRFYNELSEVYPEEDVIFKTPSGIVRKRFVEGLLKRFGTSPFVDIGCGGGVYLNAVEGSVTGVDVALGSLLRARKIAPSAFLISGDAANLAFIRPGTYRSALCSEVIEHLPEPQKLPDGIFDILADDGIMILTCPNFIKTRPMTENSKVIAGFGIAEAEYIHTAYKPAELAQMAEKSGFAILEQGTFEKELRLWRFIPRNLARFFGFFAGKSHIFSFENRVSVIIFYFLRLTGIAAIMRRIVREGCRSYIVAQKPQRQEG